MNTFIALLRGINIGGNTILPMRDLVGVLEGLGLKNVKKVFYLHAPDGIGRSKLAAKVEKALGVAVTARNWRTVSEVMSLAMALAD